MNHYRHRGNNGKGKKILFILMVVILLTGGFFLYSYSQYQYHLETPVSEGDTANVPFVIKEGENVGSIAKELISKNLIGDEKTFTWYNRLNGTDRKLVSGRFMLNRGMTIPEIVTKLSDSTKSQVIITIPEGSTIVKIDQKLVGLELIKAGDFIQATKNFKNYSKYPFLNQEKIQALPYPLEGFLFPDTYFVSPNDFNTEDLIDLMLKNFQKRVTQDFEESLSQKDKELLEIITMASIIEQEVNTDKDRPIIAGILWKRLQENWQLGADATLLYLKDNRTINAQDLQENSAYNSRKFKGLPPGPIGNPGLESIEASLNPEESPYYFYLNRADTGAVVYAKTNEEHNLNRQKYLP